jgi:hypothetical protein
MSHQAKHLLQCSIIDYLFLLFVFPDVLAIRRRQGYGGTSRVTEERQNLDKHFQNYRKWSKKTIPD